MIGKIFEKTNAKSLFKYVNKDDAKYLGGTLIFDNESSFLSDFNNYMGTKKITKPAIHIILSQPENQDLTDEEWLQAIEIYLQEMGIDLESFGWAAVKHEDTKHGHTHVIVTKRNMEGKLWNSSYSKYRSISAVAKVEQEMQLSNQQSSIRTASFKNKTGIADVKIQPAKQHHQLKRAALKDPRKTDIFGKMQATINKTMQENKHIPMSQFKALLKAKNIDLDIQTNQDKSAITGLVYSHTDKATGEKTAFKSSDLGAKFMFKNLHRRLEYYNDLGAPPAPPEFKTNVKIIEKEDEPVIILTAPTINPTVHNLTTELEDAPVDIDKLQTSKTEPATVNQTNNRNRNPNPFRR